VSRFESNDGNEYCTTDSLVALYGLVFSAYKTSLADAFIWLELYDPILDWLYKVDCVSFLAIARKA
jgi:hypothetical protein